MNPQVKSIIEGLCGRATVLAGRNLAGEDLEMAVGRELKRYVTSAASDKEVADMVIKAWEDPEVMRQLCGLRIEQGNNFMYASLKIAASFFEIVNLGDTDRPVWQNNTMQETRVSYIGQDNTARLSDLVIVQDEIAIPLRRLSAECPEYQIQDIYNGDVRQSALATLNMAFDKKAKVDKLAFTLLRSTFGSFKLTGKKSGRVYVPHSSINPDVLPDGNKVTVPDTTNSSLFRFQVFDAVIDYCARFVDAFPDGDLLPTGRIHVSALDTTGPLKQVAYTGNNDNRLDGGATNNYLTLRHGGITWTVVPNNTIAPGKAYPELTKKVGKLYFKPSQEKEKVITDEDRNMESRKQHFVFGAYSPMPHYVNALEVTYRS